MSAKLPAALLALVFALAFGGVGLYFGLWGMASATYAWYEARAWQPVSAKIVEVNLDRRDGESTTYLVRATYHYRFDGRDYVGQRVGIDGAKADNVGHWQQDMHARLARAASVGDEVTAYVDPRAPHRAVLDRSMRSELMLLRLPFAIAFTAVGFGALWIFWRLLRTPTSDLDTPRPNLRSIASNAKAHQIGTWLFAAFWNAIAIPAALLAWPQVKADGGLAWLILVFPLVGAWLVWMALSGALRYRRFGEVTLSLDPHAPAVGAAFACTLRFERPIGASCVISLYCEDVDGHDDGERITTLWAQEKPVRIAAGVARVTFLPPADLPASDAVSGEYKRWRIRLEAADGALVRFFDVTLAPFDAARTSLAVAPPEPRERIGAQEPPQLPASIGRIVTEAEGFAMELFPRRHRSAAIALAVAGAAFAALSLLARSEGSTVFFLALLAIGTGLLAAAAHLATHRRIVTVAAGEARIEARSLLRSRHRTILAMQVTNITPVVGYSSRSTEDYREHLSIKVKLRDGTSVKIADGLASRMHADAIAQLFAAKLGVPPERVNSAERAGAPRHAARSDRRARD